MDHILRQNADEVVDIGRAIGAFEAEAREDRHRMKMKGANKKGRVTGGRQGGGKPASGGGKPAGKGAGGGGGKGRGAKGGRKGKGK